MGTSKRGLVMKINEFAFQDLGDLDFTCLDSTRRAPGTIVAGKDESALVVAQAVDAANAHVVLVVDSGQICGVVSPKFVKTKMVQIAGSGPRTFYDAVALAREAPGFDAEMPMLKPILFRCPFGPHYTTEWPCPEHS
jgi:hypothetical protein